jgi:hypothetical protein
MRRLLSLLSFGAALACAPDTLLLNDPLEAQTVKVIGPDANVVVVTLAGCTTACPDSTAIRYKPSTGAYTVHVVPKGKRADSVAFSRGPAPFTVSVEVTPFRAKALAPVTISATTITPPPVIVPPPVVVPPAPVGGAFTPNLPAGLSLVLDTRWTPNPLTLSNWSTDGSGCRIVADPRGVGNVIEEYYPGSNLGNGVGGCLLEGATGQQWTRIYFAVEVWVSSDYSTHSNGEKWLYTHTTAAGDPSLQSMLVQWRIAADEAPNGATFSLDLLPNGTLTSGPNVQVYPNASWNDPYVVIYQERASPRLRKGVWQTVEVDLTMNTPAQKNGVYKAWIDGALVMSGSDAVFRGGTAQGWFNAIRFDGTRGGGASSTPTPPGGQVRRYGRFAWYAKDQ